MNAPLENVVVLDLTRVLAGPYATMLLADMGARVIKLENPKLGDDARYFPPVVTTENQENLSLYFASFNHGKESFCLDLKTKEGKDIFTAIVKSGKVDVVVENFRAGTMEKLGFGWDVIHSLNPKIIYASTSGFGHTGPDAMLPAYDILAQARGGIMSITGEDGGNPVRIGASYGDMTAGLFTAFGIVTALYKRCQSGVGEKIDVSMLDCQVSMLENALVRYQVEKQVPTVLGTAHPSLVPFQAFKAADNRFFVVGIANDSLWEKLNKAIGLNDDTLFCTIKMRFERKKQLIELLSQKFLTKKADEWIILLKQFGVPCSLISNIEDVMEDEQLKQRNMFVSLENTDVKVAGNPVKISCIEEKKKVCSAPLLGENTEEILNELLGMSADDVNLLKNKGVV